MIVRSRIYNHLFLFHYLFLFLSFFHSHIAHPSFLINTQKETEGLVWVWAYKCFGFTLVCWGGLKVEVVMIMEMGSMWVAFVAIGGALLVLRSLLKNVNWWLYESKLGVKQYSLPPGDMGWPFIGNMWSFLRAFKSGDPDSFMSSFVSR